MDKYLDTQSPGKFSALQLEFKKQLPGIMVKIDSLWDSLFESFSEQTLKELHDSLLSLADSGGTYGAEEISFLARRLYLELKSLSSEDDIKSLSEQGGNKVFSWKSELKEESDLWLKLDSPAVQPRNKVEYCNVNVVYTLLGNDSNKNELDVNLAKSFCNVKRFDSLNDIADKCETAAPSVIIVDVDFSDDLASSIDAVSWLREKINSSIPIIYISDSTEAADRLAAARAGANRYFCKPVLMNKLVYAVNRLTLMPNNHDAYRILVIDDDIPLLECYEAILSDSDFIVKTESNPLEGFNQVEKFKPDVVVMDMYMPDCSGTELVNMIRQDDRWSLIPVIFLSAEQDVNNQLDAMELGADDFLVKPVHANKLVAKLNATAKIARKNVKLTYDLKNALRENKYQLVTLDEHAIVSSADVAGRIIHVNDKLCEISGYSRDELIGHNHRILKSDYHSASFYKGLWNTISNGEVWHGVICNYSKSGDEYWVDSTIVPFLDEKGKPYKYVSIRTDITNVRVNERRLQSSQVFAGIGTWDWNIATGDLHWSDQIWPLFGYNNHNVSTSYENFINAVHPDDRQAVTSAVNNCVENRVDYDIEHRVVWPDGSVHWLLERGDVVRNREGEAKHMLGVVQDITELKMAELKRQSNNQILEMIVRGKPLGDILKKIVLDAETILPSAICSILLLDSNRKYFEYSIAPNLPDFYNKAIEGLEIGPGVGSCGDAAFTGKRVIASNIMEHPNWVAFREVAQKAGLKACWSEPFSSSSGDVLGTFAIYYKDIKEPGDSDINILVELAQYAAIAVERNLSQYTLMWAKEEAEKANMAKSQFLSSMSHELRTPMNAIMGFSQLLKMTKSQPLTKAQETNVDEIIVAGTHLMQLINEVLDLAKIESGHIELSISKVKISNLIIESIQLISPLAVKRGIEILLVKNGEEITLEELSRQSEYANLDPTRFKQIVLNLMSNAVKYNNEKGKIILACESDKGNFIRISVTDTGPGLTKEKQKQLFMPFNRLGHEQTDIEGTGIGLVITKKIVELMSGNIGLESEPGVGSTFWIELPREPDNMIVKKEHPDTDVISHQSELLAKELRETENVQSVLYIEDNPANLRLVEQLLSTIDNLHMWSAPEPLLGLELALEHLPDLILLDINLPGMDGYEVLKQLKKTEKLVNTPVVAISANAMPKDIDKGISAGFDAYITKPVNVNELLEVVQSKLNKN